MLCVETSLPLPSFCYWKWQEELLMFWVEVLFPHWDSFRTEYNACPPSKTSPSMLKERNDHDGLRRWELESRLHIERKLSWCSSLRNWDRRLHRETSVCWSSAEVLKFPRKMTDFWSLEWQSCWRSIIVGAQLPLLENILPSSCAPLFESSKPNPIVLNEFPNELSIPWRKPQDLNQICYQLRCIQSGAEGFIGHLHYKACCLAKARHFRWQGGSSLSKFDVREERVSWAHSASAGNRVHASLHKS